MHSREEPVVPAMMTEAKSPPSQPWLQAGLVVAGALVQIVLLWGTSVPLGVPGEWTWARVGWNGETLWAGVPAVISGMILMVYTGLAARVVASWNRWIRAGLLVGLWLGGTLWILMLPAAIPGIAGIGRLPMVLYYPRSSGYFAQARYDVASVREFLATYERRIEDSDDPENYLHMGTHPPGLTLVFVGLLDACQRFPALTEFLLATQPAPFRESLDEIRRNERRAGKDVRAVDSAVLWLASILAALLAAGTSVPLYLLARRHCAVETAWWTAALWLLVPAVAVFFPKSDIVFPCLVMWGQWFWLTGVDRQNFWFGVAAGAVTFMAMCLSLAYAPVGLIFTLQGLLVPAAATDPLSVNAPRRGILHRIPSLPVFLGAGLAFLLLVAACWWWGAGINVVGVWIHNLHNHAAFYSHHVRTYWHWLAVNPLELALALGLPISLTALLGLGPLLRPAESFRRELAIPVAVWGLLWISGKNMGEAARLWIFLMPYAVWLGSESIERLLQRTLQGRNWVIGLFLLQLLVCLATVLRIDGFHFAELLPAG